jgi:hypothetical protein
MGIIALLTKPDNTHKIKVEGAQTQMAKHTTLPTHGGKRAGAGRRRRLNAVKKTILIDQITVDILTDLGDGYLGRGIDKAADIINQKTKAKP